jgi:hypothetical protein
MSEMLCFYMEDRKMVNVQNFDSRIDTSQTSRSYLIILCTDDRNIIVSPILKSWAEDLSESWRKVQCIFYLQFIYESAPSFCYLHPGVNRPS